MHHAFLRVVRASVPVLVLGSGFAVAYVAQGGPVPTTLADFFQPGTQPFGLVDVVLDSPNCASCHGGYDEAQEPYTRWAASLMAQSSRDPVFWAALAVAEQDAAFAGDLCLRCHTPGAWLDGRSTPTDGSALDPGLGDFDGVTCHLCHRMVDPQFEEGASPEIDRRLIGLLGANAPHEAGGGQYVVDPRDVRRGPFDLGPSFYLHDWEESPFHRESLLCATCHDVSNPVLVRQPDGSYALGALGAEHPTQAKADEFPIERTYGEWSMSHFARRPIEMGGRFGGNKTAVASCQDCHMPDTSGTACQPVLGGAQRDDLPRHDFNGANSWVLDAVRSLYPDAETGLSDASVADAKERTRASLAAAADLFATVDGGDLVVRVVNQTGHKLPTGYPEGRRMWLEVRFLDAAGQTLALRGAYDASSATLSTGDTKVYEAELGLDAAMAAATGKPVGPGFHFVLNNVVYADNRIPPRGFTADGFAAVQAAPVGHAYDEERYWDDTRYAIPAGTARAEVRLLHQTTSREYVEFLRNENTTNGLGQIAYDQWVAHGKSEPVMMRRVAVAVPAAPFLPPQAYGLAKITSQGREPALGWSGAPSASGGGFALTVAGGLPGQSGALLASATPASVPYHGGFLLLGGQVVRVAPFVLDAQGRAAIALPVTPAMVGTQRNFQAVFRDPTAASPWGLTNALHVDFAK